MKRITLSTLCKLSTLFALILILFIACKKQDTITVAIAGPMSGPEAKMGADFRNAVTLAVEEWNAKGGVLGKKINLLVGDDQSDPKQAVSVANKFVTQGVVAVIGHFNSSCSIPASDIYHRADIPMITPASTNPQLTERGYKNVFRICGRDDQQGMVAAEFIKRKLGLKKIAIIHDRTTYGQGLADEVKKVLEGYAQIVYYGGITKGEQDFKPVLTAIKEKKPDIIYFGGIYPEAGLIIKQAREIGIKAIFMSGDGTIDPKFIEIAGPAAEGTYLTFGQDPEKLPTAKEFLKKYRERFGEPGPYSIYAYDATNVLLTAIREAGTTDGKMISQKLHELEFKGALGDIKFDEKGDVVKSPYVVWITKNKRFEEYWRP
ncbi:MAG: branched-chain amino acid ABC transporter substrate-binding protein [Thermodesulfovibrionales bacterium]|nr:branched-chain amino acid ABC transporter substrate-binding protein [Thermodesulfovibrionales bacterium]